MSVGELLAPISVEEPSGTNLEYDGDFAKLERAAQGRPEQQMGSTLVPAEEPDWKVVARDAQALLGRTKDLRIAIHLSKALLRTGGLEGFSEGLFVLRGLLEGYWDTVHPRLDPDDDNDPTMRMNALAALCDGPTLVALRVTPLVNSRAAGRYSLRDIAVASGELPPPNKDEPGPTMASIQGAFDSLEVEALATMAKAAKSARDDVTTIETLVTDKVGGAQAVNLSKLSALLVDAHRHLSGAMARRQDQNVQQVVTGGDGPTAPEGQRRSSGGPLGQINSRDDVIRAIDLICAYYERHEPNSPVPILMKRSKRFATMTFLEIMKDVAPDAMSQAALLKGHSAEDEGS